MLISVFIIDYKLTLFSQGVEGIKVQSKEDAIELATAIVGEENIKINSDVVKEFNKKISSINAKITRNKESISKNNEEIKGLMSELNELLQLNGYKDVNIYRNYLHNLKFILKKY